ARHRPTAEGDHLDGRGRVRGHEVEAGAQLAARKVVFLAAEADPVGLIAHLVAADRDVAGRGIWTPGEAFDLVDGMDRGKPPDDGEALELRDLADPKADHSGRWVG